MEYLEKCILFLLYRYYHLLICIVYWVMLLCLGCLSHGIIFGIECGRRVRDAKLLSMSATRINIIKAIAICYAPSENRVYICCCCCCWSPSSNRCWMRFIKRWDSQKRRIWNEKKKYHCVKPMWLIILLNLNLDWKSECVSQKSEKKPKRKRIRNDNGNISQRSFPLFIQFLPELAQ